MSQIKQTIRKYVPADRGYVDRTAEKLQKQIKALQTHFDAELQRRDRWMTRRYEVRQQAEGRPVWVIKCPAPDAERKATWGDWHFALSLQKNLERQGICCTVDLKEDWPCDCGADVVLVLRGLYPYQPAVRDPDCTYIIWNISHPAQVTDEEYAFYDIICVASEHYADLLSRRLGRTVNPLLQCTDTDLFHPADDKESSDRTEQRDGWIFIGNTREVERECVLWALEDGIPLKIWGKGWKKYLTQAQMNQVQDSSVMNSELPDLYRSARVTLNDHWEDMLRAQFINNRIFDALACGLPVISDTCDELKKIFPDAVLHYANREEYESCVRRIRDDYEDVAANVRKVWPLIRDEYSFEARAKQLLKLAEPFLSQS